MRVLSDADVVACLPPVTEVVDLMAHGLAALADGSADVRPKQGVSSRPGAFTGAIGQRRRPLTRRPGVGQAKISRGRAPRPSRRRRSRHPSLPGRPLTGRASTHR